MNELRNGYYKSNVGAIFCYKEDILHCDDGPALITQDGSRFWFLDGVELTEEEFNHWLSKKELNETLHKKLKEKDSIKKLKI